MKTTSIRTCLLTVLFLAAAGTVTANDLDYEIRLGATYSDNVGRNQFDTVDDTYLSTGLGLDWSHVTRSIELGLLLDATFNHFLDDTFDDEVIGESQAKLLFTVIPDWLIWNTKNEFGTVQTDVLEADTPDNRGTANRFRTGPNIVLPIGARTFVELDGTLAISSFEERDTDNDEVSGAVSFRRDLSPVRSIFITGTYGDVSFESDALKSQDYERISAFVGIRSKISSGEFSASIGTNEIEILGQTLDGTTFNVSISRELSSRTSLTVGYDQRFSSSGDIFRRFSESARDFGDTLLVADNGDPFESRTGNIGLTYSGDRTTLGLRLSFDNQDFESDNILERKDLGASFSWTRSLPSDWAASAGLFFRKGEFTSVERTDDDLSARLRISKNLTARLSLDVSYRYINRSSDEVGSEFTENAVSLTVNYSPR